MKWIKVGEQWPDPLKDILFVWKPNLVTMGFCINKRFYSYETNNKSYPQTTPENVGYWAYIPDPPED